MRGVIDADPDRLEAAHTESFDIIERARARLSNGKSSEERNSERHRRRELVRRCRLTALLFAEALVRLEERHRFDLFVRMSKRPVEILLDLRDEYEALGPVHNPVVDLLSREGRRLEGLKEWQATLPFCRQWFLFVIARLHGLGFVAEAGRLVDRALDVFEDDAELRLARGSLFESSAQAMIVDLSAADELYSKLERRIWRESLESAARDFQRALDAAPDSREAMLRLGRVSQVLGDAARARVAFDAVLESPDAAPFLRYHALLFLGQLDEQEGDSARAAAQYREALVVMPVAQAPALALSRLNDGAGNIADARRWLIRSLVAVSPERDDPWWRYARGQEWQLSQRLQRLRETPMQ